MRFVAPSARPTRRVHWARVCHTRYVPSPGFRTLLTAFSSTGCPAVFQTGSAHGVPALQSFSLARSRPTSRWAMPSCRWRRPVARGDRSARLQGVAPRVESVASPLIRRSTARSMLSWASDPLQGSLTRAAPDASIELLPRASSIRVRRRPEGRHRPGRPAPRSICELGSGRGPGASAALMGFSHLVDVLSDLRSALPWLMGSPRGRHHVTVAPGSLFGQ
jgi:hypothetical protein